MKKVLITGSNGFTARYLIRYLRGLKEKLEISGIDISKPKSFSADKSKDAEINMADKVSSGNFANIGPVDTGYNYYDCNLVNRPKLTAILNQINPDYIFHLAGVMNNKYKNVFRYNVYTTCILLEAVRKINLNPVILSIGSAAEYGMVKKEEIPIKETNPLRPINIYGLSKVCQTLLCQRYFLTLGFKIIIVRTFNLIGPGLPSLLVCGSFANQIRRIKLEKKSPEIRVGNLNTNRDFIDVRDAVDAYWKIANTNSYGEIFNLGSGKQHSTKYVLNTFIKYSGIEDIQIIKDETLIRKVDIQKQIADISKIKKIIDWKPSIPIKRSLKEMLET